MRLLLALLPVLLVAAPVRADFFDGNKLKEGLEAKSAPAPSLQTHSRFLEALGYVEGITDTLGHLGIACPTENVTAGQVGDVVLNHLNSHPEQRHLAAARLVHAAISAAFPCPKK